MTAEQHGEYKRWPILVACFVSNITTASLTYHAGVLHVALLNTFHQDVVTTAWLGAFYGSLWALSGPVCSLIINKYNCRTCIVLSGVLCLIGYSACFFINDFFYLFPALGLAGAGHGLTVITNLVALSFNFPRTVTVVTGIGLCGSGLGMFIHPPLLQVLVDEYGLRGALLIMGAVAAHCIPCALLVTPSQFEKQRHQAADSSTRMVKALTTRFRSSLDVLADAGFLLLLFSGVVFQMALSAYSLFLLDFLLHHGHAAITASFVVSAGGAGSVSSRLLSGLAANDERIDTLTLFIGGNAMTAVSALLVPVLANSMAAQMVLGVSMGLYTATVITTNSPLLLKLLGMHRLATGTGMYFFVMGLATLVGAPVVGTVYTALGSFSYIFYFAGALFAVGSLLGMLFALTKSTLAQHTPDTAEQTSDQKEDTANRLLTSLHEQDTTFVKQNNFSNTNLSNENAIQTKALLTENGMANDDLFTQNCESLHRIDFQNFTIGVKERSKETDLAC